MSHAREETVVCPGCAKPGQVTLFTSVDVAAEPELKERLARGRLSVFTCANCGREARIVHPLLYKDPSRELVVQLDPEGTIGVESLVRGLGEARPRVTRVVRDGNALIEKVRIDDAGLDDRVVEVMKLLLQVSHAEHMNAPWYFERTDEAVKGGGLLFTIVTAKAPLATRRPRAEYDALAKDLETRGALAPLAPFATIDRAWARQWLGEAPPAPVAGA
jgi:CpXC protein